MVQWKLASRQLSLNVVDQSSPNFRDWYAYGRGWLTQHSCHYTSSCECVAVNGYHTVQCQSHCGRRGCVLQRRLSHQVLPKVIWEECVATPYDKEWNRPLRVLLAAQHQLQTNLITQQRVCYIHAAMPHVSYTVLSDSLPSKKICPFLTGDINPQSSRWNTHTTISRPSWILSGTIQVSRHQKR